jgi:hypothetical protein
MREWEGAVEYGIAKQLPYPTSYILFSIFRNAAQFGGSDIAGQLLFGEAELFDQREMFG